MTISFGKKELAVGAAALAGMLPLATFAQGAATPLPGSIGNVGGFFTLLDSLMGIMYGFFLVLAVLMILWAAFLYLTAGGNDEQVGNAKKFILYSVIALVVAFLANSIPDLVNSFLSGAGG